MFSRGWPHSITHFSNEDLLVYLDGEASPTQAKDIEKHLKSCWGCRARLHEIEEAVTGFVMLRQASVDSTGAAPPKGWREFEIRLEQLATQSKPPSFLARWSVFLGAQFKVRRVAELSAAALVVAAVCLWLILPAPRASAKEVLARAGEAEVNMAGRVPNPVVYQKLRVRRSAPRTALQEGTVEVWSDDRQGLVGHRAERRLWQDLDKVLEANRLARQPLVSARAFSSWRSSIHPKSETAEPTNSPTGTPAILVRTTASEPYTENQIVKGEILVRASDWLTLSQTWHVQGQDEVLQYELLPVEQSVVARSAVPPSILADLPALSERVSVPLPPPPLPSVQPAFPTAPEPAVALADPDVVEIEARYALHRRGDCLTGLIKVQRESRTRIVVGGLAETASQKEELLAVLPNSPLITVDIKTLDELDASAAAPAKPWEPSPDARAKVRDQEIPVADLLRPRLAALYGAANVPRRLAALANEAVSSSRTMRMDAWALRRLAERYGSSNAPPVAQSARWMLEAMMREHVLRLRAETERSATLLEPLWGSAGPRPALPSESPEGRPGTCPTCWREYLDLVDSIEGIDALIQEMFTASGRPLTPVAPMIQNLQTAFARLDTEFHKVETRLALSTGAGEKP